MATNPCDWRGVPITPGSHVLYACGQGTRAQVIEGQVRPPDQGPMVEARGRVFVNVIRKTIGNGTIGGHPTIAVNPANLTVLSGPLPATAALTDEAAREIERQEMAERRRREKTHKINAGRQGRFCQTCNGIGDDLWLRECYDQALAA